MRQKAKTIKINHKRQKNLFDPARFQESISLVGLGNIGSHTALGLARMGLKHITIYDFDIIEKHNLASQCYRLKKDVGRFKTESLKEIIEESTGIKVKIAPKFTNQKLYGIVIICIDSMKERKRICKELKKYPPKTIIDARMGGDTLEIYTRFSPEEYEKTLVETVQRVPCAARYISYSSLICSGLIINQIKRLLRGEIIKPNIILDISTLRFV